MPIRKYRSIEDMEDERWYEPGEPALLEAVDGVWDFAARTCPRRFPPGVYKHRSLEEMDALREIWAQADFDALWAARRLGMIPVDSGPRRG